MRVKRIVSVGILGLLTSVAQAVPFAELIESDVQLFVSVRSLSESRADWATHPIADLLEDEGVQAFIDTFSDEDAADEPGFTEVMETEFGLTWDELFELLPGQVSMAFYNLTDAATDKEARTEMTLMAEFSGDHARMNELMQIQFERNARMQKEANPLVEHRMIEESFMGETLYFDETFDGETTYIEDGYALVDGIYILATPESRLRSAVEVIKEGAADPIAKTDVYLRAMEAAGRGDLRIYLNLSEIMAPLNELMVAKAAEGGLAMFGVTGQSLERALSLNSMQALYVDIDLAEQGVLSHSGLIFSEKKGLLSLLTYSDEDLPEATYVPDGVLASTVSTFDFGAMLSQLEKTLALASPSVPMLLDIQLQQIQNNTGIDLRSSFLENLGGEVVSLSVLKEASLDTELLQPEQLYVIKVKDAQALSLAIETLKDMAPGVRDLIESQEYEGQTIFTVKAQRDPNDPNAQANDVSYVISRSELIVNVGRIGLLQKVLTRMNASTEGFWQSAETEQMFEWIARPNPVTRSYMDLEQMVKPLLESMLQGAAMSGVLPAGDPAKIPSELSAPLRLISESNEEPDGFFVRTLILKTEATE